MAIEASATLIPPQPVPPQIQLTLSVEAAHALRFLVGRANVGEIWSIAEHSQSDLVKTTSKPNVYEVTAAIFSQLGVVLQQVQ